MRKYNLVIGLICTTLLLINLYSCETPQSNAFKIGVSQCSDDLWRTTLNQEILDEVSLYKDLTVVIKTSKDNTDDQILDIQALIDEKVDLLIISPNESTGLTDIVLKANSKNIPVVLVDRKVNTDQYTAFISADNEKVGTEVAHYVSSLLNNKGNIVVIRGLDGSTSDAERYNGFAEELQFHPEIHIIAEPHADFFQQNAEQAMSTLIETISEPIDLVFALNDPMARGVSQAYARYTGSKPYIIGIDALSGEGGGIELIQNGNIHASFIYPTGGDKVIELAHNILTHQPYIKNNTLNTAVVEKDNLRIKLMQDEQVKQNRDKIERINNLLNKSLTQYATQRILLYVIIFVLVLILYFLFVIYRANKAKVTAIRQLRLRNEEIKQQAETLEEQKNQLQDLSTQLEYATQAKLIFFTNISHELKTPLTLILGPVESLKQSTNMTKDQQQMVDLIHRNAIHLSRLIAQIIEFRTLENDKLRINYSQDDLGVFISDLSSSFQDFSTRKQINFHLNIDSADWLIYMDKDKLEKIYFNLLSNAFKYTPVHGDIIVNTHFVETEQTLMYELSVFNSGSNIPDAELENIFTRFYTLDAEHSGTGIGLTYTRALIEQMGGTIHPKNIENKGISFIVQLPYLKEVSEEERGKTINPYKPSIPDFVLVDVEDKETANKEEEIILEDNEKDSILVIEDNADVRAYIYSILGKEYHIIESENGRLGIEKAKELIPDLIISDVMMPEKDGLEVCRELKSNVSTSHIPIILLTACSLEEQKVLGFESGADAYIPKPFNAQILAIRVRKLIENRRKIKEAFHTDVINDTRRISLEDSEQKFISKFENYVSENISNSDLNVDNIASFLHLSKSQMYRKVKSLTDLSPNEYVRIIRLKAAKLLLSTTGKSISEVAYEVGFSSPSYFTKCFKDIYDINPTDYIEKLE